MALDAVRAGFEQLAAEQFHHVSPLYERLATGIAHDPEILVLAAQGRKGQQVLLFFGAVHYLLLRGTPHRLATFYPSVVQDANQTDDPYPAFRSFCLAHRSEIAEIITTRRVQTNEVQRCACLLPAFTLVSRLCHDQPFALLEIGSSAGLNLLWDRYSYDYGDGRHYGAGASPVRIICRVRGAHRPPLPVPFPKVASRVGIDLNPIDLLDAESALWLRALIWPEHRRRAELLLRAVDIARRDPPPLIKGDALDLLPTMLASIPPEVAVCVMHAHVLYQLPADVRERLASLLAEHAATRPLFRVSMEWFGGDHSVLDLVTFTGGKPSEQRLAHCDAHGNWIEWLQSPKARVQQVSHQSRD